MTLELSNVKPILQALVDNGALKPEQQQWVLDGIKNGLAKGQFSGQVAVAAGMISAEQLDHALHEQAVLKGQAAAKDIKTIAANGTQEIPAFLKVNLGNNGVAAAAANPPERHDAAAAAANIAQNIVVMANRAPQLAGELQTAVESAGALAVYLGNHDAQHQQPVPMDVLKQWQQDAADGLRKVAKHFEQSETLRNALLHDNTPEAQPAPKVEQVEAYLAERSKEIDAGIAMSSPWQSKMRENKPGSPDLPPR